MISRAYSAKQCSQITDTTDTHKLSEHVSWMQNWQVPSDLKALHAWMGRMSERDSWKKTYYTEKYVRDGWNLKVKMEKESS